MVFHIAVKFLGAIHHNANRRLGGEDVRQRLPQQLPPPSAQQALCRRRPITSRPLRSKKQDTLFELLEHLLQIAPELVHVVYHAAVLLPNRLSLDSTAATSPGSGSAAGGS